MISPTQVTTVPPTSNAAPLTIGVMVFGLVPKAMNDADSVSRRAANETGERRVMSAAGIHFATTAPRMPAETCPTSTPQPMANEERRPRAPDDTAAYIHTTLYATHDQSTNSATD